MENCQQNNSKIFPYHLYYFFNFPFNQKPEYWREI